MDTVPQTQAATGQHVMNTGGISQRIAFLIKWRHLLTDEDRRQIHAALCLTSPQEKAKAA